MGGRDKPGHDDFDDDFGDSFELQEMPLSCSQTAIGSIHA
jgi:hypothetical protein